MKKQSVIMLKCLFFFVVLFQNTDFMETNEKVKV